MIATSVAVLALAGSAVATDLGGNQTLNMRAKRGASHDLSPEDFQSKLQWPIEEALRAGLKHPDLLNKEAQANLKERVAAWSKKRAMEAPLKNWGTSYSVEVGIGTPLQMFDSLIDTGSGDFWVIERCNDRVECGNSKPFDETQSSSFQGSSEPYSIQYVKGETSGYWVQDIVSIGEQANMTWFGAADTVTEWNTAMSSLIGFSFKGGSTGHSPWWLQVVSGWPEPIFSMYLGRTEDDNAAYRNPVSNNGQLILGGSDTSMYTGDVNWVPVSHSRGQPVYWEVPLDGVKVGGQQVQLTALQSSSSGYGSGSSNFGFGRRNRLDRRQGSNDTLPLPGPSPPQQSDLPTGDDLPASSRAAVIDSGTTLIYAPQQDVDAVYSAIPGAITAQGQYFFPVPEQGRAINITFTFGGVEYPIYDGDLAWQCGTARQFGIRGGNQMYCQGTIQPQTGANDWLIGQAFMKNVYSLFRNEPMAVGFAPLSASANVVYGTPWLPAAGTGGGTGQTSSGSQGGSVSGSGGSSGSSSGSGSGSGSSGDSSFNSGAVNSRGVSAGALLGLLVSVSLWLL